MAQPKKPRQRRQRSATRKKKPNTVRTVCRSCGLIQDTDRFEFHRSALPRCVACGGGLDKIGFAARIKAEQAKSGDLPPDAPKWHEGTNPSRPASPDRKRTAPEGGSLHGVDYEPGVVPYGKLSGRRLCELSLERLAGINSIALRSGPPAFLRDLATEMDRRRRGVPPQPYAPPVAVAAPPQAKSIRRIGDVRSEPVAPFDGRVAFGTYAGQKIGNLSDEALRGCLWHAGHPTHPQGPPGYLEVLRAECRRRGLGACRGERDDSLAIGEYAATASASGTDRSGTPCDLDGFVQTTQIST